MVVALVVVGIAAQAAAWRLVGVRGLDVWTGIGVLLGALGALALVVRSPAASGSLPLVAAVAVGVAAGAALYAATRAFVLVVRRWRAFGRHARAMYARPGPSGFAARLFLAAGVAAAGEELFWRGLVQSEAVRGLGTEVAGALVAWAAYVAVDLFGANLAIAAGAVVGGAVWTALAWWTGGVLASVACHATWTGLMVGLPVVRVDPR